MNARRRMVKARDHYDHAIRSAARKAAEFWGGDVRLVRVTMNRIRVPAKRLR